MDLNQFRQQYPQYDDIDDETLVNSLHEKFYSDIPKDEFRERIRPIEETAGVVEGFVGGTKRYLSSIQTGLTAPFTSGEEASVEGIEREKKITERSATSLENVKRTFKDEGLRAAAGEVISQAPAAIAEQSPILASIYGGFRLVKNVPGPVGVAARIITPMLPIFFSMAGSNMQRKAEEDIAQGRDVDVNEIGAYATAFGQTAVERTALALSGVARLLGLSAVKETGTEVAERLAKESLTKAITKGTAKFAAFEIPTEVSQQMMERYYAGLSLTDDDAMNEYAETAFAVSLMSPIGSFAGYRQRSDAKAIADPVNKDPGIQYNDTKDNEEKDTKELNETADKDLELKQKGDALLNADLDPEKMPVGPTEEEILIEEQRKIMEEQSALTDEQVDEIAAQEGITGPEVAEFDEAAFRSQLKPNSTEMSAKEQKSYLDSGVLPESYVQREIDKEKRRIENEQKQTGPGASLKKGVGAGIAASVSAADPSTMEDSAKATEEFVGTPVDDSISNTGRVVGGKRRVDPTLDKKEKTKFDKKEEKQRKKLEKRREKIIEREATDEEYNIDKPNLVDERTKIRINDFDSPLDTNEDKQKISQEVQSLAKN